MMYRVIKMAPALALQIDESAISDPIYRVMNCITIGGVWLAEQKW
jgi:hypothetical protein